MNEISTTGIILFILFIGIMAYITYKENQLHKDKTPFKKEL